MLPSDTEKVMTSLRRPGARRRRAPRKRLLLPAPESFSLRETVLSHGWYELAPFEWDAGSATLIRGEILPDGSTHLLRIRQPSGKGRRLRVDFLTGPASPKRCAVLEQRLRRMLALELDLSGFLVLCRREPRLRYVPRVGAGRFLSAGNVYEDVFKGICGTNIAWRQAVAAVNRIAGLGQSIGRTGSRAFPTPREVIGCGPSRLSELSRLGYRVPYLLEWAERAEAGEPTLSAAEAGELDPECLRRFFLSVRGVGRTTSQYLLMLRGVADQIPIDSSVLLYCRENRFGGRTPTEQQIRRLYDRYGSWKAYAYWFEFLPWARGHWSLDGKRRRK